MSEEVNQSVDEAVAQPAETEVVQEIEQESQEPQKGSKEYNFRQLESRLDEERQRRQELENYIRSRDLPQQQTAPVEEDLPSADDYISRKQAEAIFARKARELLQEQDVATQEDRTRLRFKDYDDVVTDKNVQELIEGDDILAATLKTSPNPYESAYKLIKKSAFYQVKGSKQNREVEKMTKNAQKPVSSNTVATRPLAGANNFANISQAERNELYAEMESAKGRRN